MARRFGAAEYLYTNQGRVTVSPRTLSAWFKADNFAADRHIVATCSTANWNGYVVMYSRTTGRVALNIQGAIIQSTTTVTAGKWHHGCLVEYSNDSRAIFLDGGGKATDASVRNPTGIDNLTIGARAVGNGIFNEFLGEIAEVAVYQAALTDEEVMLLARGISPLSVRGRALTYYVPLVGTDLSDCMARLVMSQRAGIPAVVAHPPLYRPAVRRFRVGTPAAPSAVLSPYYYLHLLQGAPL